MNRFRWRLWLPIVHLALAIALSLVGRTQTQQRTSGNIMIWDYIAPAEVLLHSINYPAALIAGLATGHRTFQIGIEYSISVYLAYLLSILILWYVIGAYIEKSLLRTEDRGGIPGWVCLFALLAGVSLLGAFGMLKGPYGWLLVASAFLWSGLFLAIFTTLCVTWRRQRRSAV